MNRLTQVLAGLLALATIPAHAWSNHSLVSYRAFERMPEVAKRRLSRQSR